MSSGKPDIRWICFEDEAYYSDQCQKLWSEVKRIILGFTVLPSLWLLLQRRYLNCSYPSLYCLTSFKKPDTFHIHLLELNNFQSQTGSFKVHSKGFFPEISGQDCPICGHKVFYHIKRRRWIDIQSNALAYRDWTLVEKGTRMTGEFAAFLKEINRYGSE